VYILELDFRENEVYFKIRVLLLTSVIETFFKHFKINNYFFKKSNVSIYSTSRAHV